MSHDLHNTKLIIENNNLKPVLQQLCNRDDLLDINYKRIINNRIKKNEKLLFLGNDHKESPSFHKYKIFLYGILPCGSKTTLEINGIIPYIDIKGDNSISKTQNIKNTKKLLNENKIKYDNIEINEGKEFILYNENNSYFIKIYFNTIQNRSSAIEYFNSKNIISYNNDKYSYFRVAARNYKINLASWNIIDNYQIIYDSLIFKSKFHIKVNINDICAYKDEHYEMFEDIPKQILKYDNTISMCYDIEAYTSNKKGNLPCGKNVEDILFMICLTFQFINSKKYLLNICLVTSDCEPQEDLLTIVCKNETNLIKMFANLCEIIQPDFITEFNGSEFDWPFLIDKAEYFNLIVYLAQHMSVKKLLPYELDKEKILKYNYKVEQIKAEAGRNIYSLNLNMQGYLPFDTRIIFKKLYPIESKSSLNFYLELENLGSKDEMSINELFRIYEQGTPEEMKLVAHYCLIDSWKLHLLNSKKNVIQDKREVCVLSYTSMFDGFYRADGLKVRNLIISTIMDKNFYMNNLKINKKNIDEDEEKRKFPGAMVLNPTKGLVSNLFTIYEFNKKTENKLCNTQLQIVQKFVNENYKDFYINKKLVNHNIQDNNIITFINKYYDYIKNNNFKYPVSGLDFSSLYPSLIMTYNLSPEFLITDEHYANNLIKKGIILHKIDFMYDEKQIIAWTVRHDESKDITNFGIYPWLLRFLKKQRTLVRNEKYYKLEKDKEYYEKNIDNYTNNDKYHEIVADFNYLDGKQKALKVFMNTFYGELGNQTSPLFILPLAGGVTSSGRYNLMLIHKYVSGMNCQIYYGDSVSGDTPVLIKNKINNIFMTTIDDIVYFPNISNKISINCYDLEVLMESGWIKLKKVIRHKTKKKMYRISNKVGSVIVTEDHSLLDYTGKKILTPNDLMKKNQKLLIWDDISILNIYENTTYNIDNLGKSIFYGFFYKHGKINNDEFSLSHLNKSYLLEIINIFNLNFKKIEIQLKLTNKKLYNNKYNVLLIGNTKKYINLFKKLFYTLNGYKKIPSYFYNECYKIKKEFIYGYTLDDPLIKEKMICYSQIEAHGLFMIFKYMHYNVNIELDNNIFNKYYIIVNNHINNIGNDNSNTKIEYIGCNEQYVYDLETENHHFAAGIGQLVVHNTDSLYISCPSNCYSKITKDYYTNHIDKQEYNNKLIENTFKAIELIKNSVNKILYKNNGTKYLKMSYEEVLYPVVFLSKKKYYGIPHIGIINFKPNKLFIKGLEVKKRGVSQLLRIVCMDIMWNSVSLNNISTIRELVNEKIHYVYKHNWNIEDFVQTGVFRPEKQNITMHLFANRMKQNGMQQPEPGDRFKFVVVRKYPYTYDNKGRQTILKKGDKMEYLEYAREKKLEIDLDYYFTNELTGQFARLISYDKEFEEYIDNTIIINEDKTFKNCQKYIKQIALIYNNSYINRGSLYKEVYRTVNKKIQLKNKSIQNNKLKFILNIGSNIQMNNIETNLMNSIEMFVNTFYNCKNESESIIHNYKKSYKGKQYLYKLHNLYNTNIKSYYTQLVKNINNNLLIKKKELMKILINDELYKHIFDLDNINIQNIINYIKSKYKFDSICKNNKNNLLLKDICSEHELEEIINNKKLYYNIDFNIIIKIYNLLIEIISIYKMIKINKHILDTVHNKICNNNKIIQTPNSFNKLNLLDN